MGKYNKPYIELVEKMLEHQNKLNVNTIGEDWMEDDKNWTLDVVLELAETIKASKYEPWRNKKIYLESLRAKIIDLLSICLTYDLDKHKDVATIIAGGVTYPEDKHIKESFTEDDIHYEFRYIAKNIGNTFVSSNSSILTSDILFLAARAGMDHKQIKERYFE